MILCIILYIDSVHFTTSTWLILPVIILGLLPILQCFIYSSLVKESCEHRYAWGMFLQPDRRSVGMYLFISQMVWFLCHTVAWVAYCVFTIVQDEEDVMFSV